jgi:protoheme IX farnesyltransferase
MSVSNRAKLSRFINVETVAAYHELTKPGITMLVLASMVMGFVMGSVGHFNLTLLLHAIIGTYLIAGGTAAHNQFIERNYDKLMKRTKSRPLPSSKISPQNGFIFSITLILVGLVYLISMVNIVAASVSAVTTIVYLAVYTPMKRISVVNVFIGSIPGALPPVGGWAAATGSILDPGMWILFGIVYLWQVPHVMAIAWLCNDDYSNAGFQMLPLGDFQGKKTALMVNLCLLTLIPITYLFYALDYANIIYLVGGLLSALYFIFYGLKFWLERSKEHAKQLMFASFFYLPLVWIFIFIDLLAYTYLL